MKYLILCLLLFSCDALKDTLGDKAGVDSDFNNDNCTSCNDDSNTDSTVYSLENDIASFYRFEETGNFENRNDDFSLNNLFSFGPIDHATGKHGNSVDCSTMGSSSYQRNTTSSGMAYGSSNDFSIGFWANMYVNEALIGYLLELDCGADYVQIYSNPSSRDVEISITGVTLNVSSVFSTDNTWFHLVYLVDRDGGLKLYVNGTLAGSNSSITTGTILPTLNEISPCGFYSGSFGSRFNGSIDSLGIWNRLLTTEEINALYNGNNTLDN
ncbi:MAG: LamG-like jellyroll fold domain-containing protein [Bdellovibrionota bacterium]|nr:LamG-like jellyroll fold domain-containing protein [Bdellovibrionota bacterium]